MRARQINVTLRSCFVGAAYGGAIADLEALFDGPPAAGCGRKGEVWKLKGRAVALKSCKFAQAYDVGDNWIVMEYVAGERIRPPTDTRKPLDIALQIADGLSLMIDCWPIGPRTWFPG
ncbi:MAG TPA: hypothetical protein VE621_08710 [Bryobacteraceae bacterium]|jgi:hypothetical protein|nr:hypothetical protein [Bryobacteraceae bacterium]